VLEARGSVAADAQFALFLLVLLPGQRGSIFPGPFCGGGLEEVDGDHARRSLALSVRQGRRELKNSLGTYEVGVKGWAEWVPAIGDARDFGSRFMHNGVIHGHDDRICLF